MARGTVDFVARFVYVSCRHEIINYKLNGKVTAKKDVSLKPFSCSAKRLHCTPNDAI